MQYLAKHEGELQPRTITVTLAKGDDFLSSASRPGSALAWYSDESTERGGQGRGASPLSYFLSAMGFCQFVHYTEHCIVDNLKLDSLEMKIDGTISLQKPRRFLDIRYEVRVASLENDERIRRLAKQAAEDCYVTNTLRAACKVTGTVIHNGTRIDEHP
jgi:uncharacterized OsmC-like protein